MTGGVPNRGRARAGHAWHITAPLLLLILGVWSADASIDEGSGRYFQLEAVAKVTRLRHEITKRMSEEIFASQSESPESQSQSYEEDPNRMHTQSHHLDVIKFFGNVATSQEDLALLLKDRQKTVWPWWCTGGAINCFYFQTAAIARTLEEAATGPKGAVTGPRTIAAKGRDSVHELKDKFEILAQDRVAELKHVLEELWDRPIKYNPSKTALFNRARLAFASFQGKRNSDVKEHLRRLKIDHGDTKARKKRREWPVHIAQAYYKLVSCTDDTADYDELQVRRIAAMREVVFESHFEDEMTRYLNDLFLFPWYLESTLNLYLDIILEESRKEYEKMLSKFLKHGGTVSEWMVEFDDRELKDGQEMRKELEKSRLDISAKWEKYSKALAGHIETLNRKALNGYQSLTREVQRLVAIYPMVLAGGPTSVAPVYDPSEKMHQDVNELDGSVVDKPYKVADAERMRAHMIPASFETCREAIGSQAWVNQLGLRARPWQERAWVVQLAYAQSRSYWSLGDLPRLLNSPDVGGGHLREQDFDREKLVPLIRARYNFVRPLSVSDEVRKLNLGTERRPRKYQSTGHFLSTVTQLASAAFEVSEEDIKDTMMAFLSMDGVSRGKTVMFREDRVDTGDWVGLLETRTLYDVKVLQTLASEAAPLDLVRFGIKALTKILKGGATTVEKIKEEHVNALDSNSIEKLIEAAVDKKKKSWTGGLFFDLDALGSGRTFELGSIWRRHRIVGVAPSVYVAANHVLGFHTRTVWTDPFAKLHDAISGIWLTVAGHVSASVFRSTMVSQVAELGVSMEDYPLLATALSATAQDSLIRLRELRDGIGNLRDMIQLAPYSYTFPEMRLGYPGSIEYQRFHAFRADNYVLAELLHQLSLNLFRSEGERVGVKVTAGAKPCFDMVCFVTVLKEIGVTVNGFTEISTTSWSGVRSGKNRKLPSTLADKQFPLPLFSRFRLPHVEGDDQDERLGPRNEFYLPLSHGQYTFQFMHKKTILGQVDYYHGSKGPTFYPGLQHDSPKFAGKFKVTDGATFDSDVADRRLLVASMGSAATFKRLVGSKAQTLHVLLSGYGSGSVCLDFASFVQNVAENNVAPLRVPPSTPQDLGETMIFPAILAPESLVHDLHSLSREHEATWPHQDRWRVVRGDALLSASTLPYDVPSGPDAGRGGTSRLAVLHKRVSFVRRALSSTPHMAFVTFPAAKDAGRLLCAEIATLEQELEAQTAWPKKLNHESEMMLEKVRADTKDLRDIQQEVCFKTLGRNVNLAGELSEDSSSEETSGLFASAMAGGMAGGVAAAHLLDDAEPSSSSSSGSSSSSSSSSGSSGSSSRSSSSSASTSGPVSSTGTVVPRDAPSTDLAGFSSLMSVMHSFTLPMLRGTGDERTPEPSTSDLSSGASSPLLTGANGNGKAPRGSGSITWVKRLPKAVIADEARDRPTVHQLRRENPSVESPTHGLLDRVRLTKGDRLRLEGGRVTRAQCREVLTATMDLTRVAAQAIYQERDEQWATTRAMRRSFSAGTRDRWRNRTDKLYFGAFRETLTRLDLTDRVRFKTCNPNPKSNPNPTPIASFLACEVLRDQLEMLMRDWDFFKQVRSLLPLAEAAVFDGDLAGRVKKMMIEVFCNQILGAMHQLDLDLPKP